MMPLFWPLGLSLYTIHRHCIPIGLIVSRGVARRSRDESDELRFVDFETFWTRTPFIRFLEDDEEEEEKEKEAFEEEALFVAA